MFQYQLQVLFKLWRRLFPCFVYLIYSEGHYDTLYWLCADVVMKRILKHDVCCGADNAVAGANGGRHTMTASVSMMTNVQCDCIDDVERELLSPLRVLPKILLMFKWLYFIFCNAFTRFYIWHSATYTLLSFICYSYDIMKWFVRYAEIKMWNQSITYTMIADVLEKQGVSVAMSLS